MKGCEEEEPSVAADVPSCILGALSHNTVNAVVAEVGSLPVKVKAMLMLCNKSCVPRLRVSGSPLVVQFT